MVGCASVGACDGLRTCPRAVAAARAPRADRSAVHLGRSHPADLLLREARDIIELDDVLSVETWASSWLGQAWSTAALTEREPEHQLCMQVTGRACTTPSPHALGAVAALARVAPAADISMLTETVAILAETQPVPAWHTGAGLDPGGGVAGGRCVRQRTGPVHRLRRTPPAHADGPALPGRRPDDRTSSPSCEPGAATAWDELREPTGGTDADPPGPGRRRARRPRARVARSPT